MQVLSIADSQYYDQKFAIDCLLPRKLRRIRMTAAGHCLSPHHFAGSYGYGHGSEGTSLLDKAIVQGEKVIVMTSLPLAVQTHTGSVRSPMHVNNARSCPLPPASPQWLLRGAYSTYLLLGG